MGLIAAIHLVSADQGFLNAAAQYVADTFDGDDKIAGLVAFRTNVQAAVVNSKCYCISNIFGFIDVHACF